MIGWLRKRSILRWIAASVLAQSIGHRNDNLRARRLSSGVLIALFGGASVGSAMTLDWSTVTWPAGSTSQSCGIDSTNPGNDITISMTSSTGNQFASGLRAIATGFGGSTTTPDLRERIQLSSASALLQRRSRSITLRVFMCET
jgi:hypothetical protein